MPTNKNILTINGTRVPGICSYRVDYEDIHSKDTERGEETGYMHLRRIRKKVKKVFVKLKLEDSDVPTVTRLIDDSEIEMHILSPAVFADSDAVNGTFYVSKVSLNLLSLGSKCYWELSFNAIEY